MHQRKTTYTIVKEMRGNFQAFMWQSMAALFGSSMKQGYDKNDPNDKLIELWNEYANLEKHSPNYKSALTTNQPQKNNNTTITFSVINTFQEEEIKSNMPELLSFLRDGLNNQQISLEVNVIPAEENKTAKPFTVKDKFISMSEKNPDIIKLKNKLELDLDY